MERLIFLLSKIMNLKSYEKRDIEDTIFGALFLGPILISFIILGILMTHQIETESKLLKGALNVIDLNQNR